MVHGSGYSLFFNGEREWCDFLIAFPLGVIQHLNIKSLSNKISTYFIWYLMLSQVAALITPTFPVTVPIFRCFNTSPQSNETQEKLCILESQEQVSVVKVFLCYKTPHTYISRLRQFDKNIIFTKTLTCTFSFMIWWTEIHSYLFLFIVFALSYKVNKREKNTSLTLKHMP